MCHAARHQQFACEPPRYLQFACGDCRSWAQARRLVHAVASGAMPPARWQELAAHLATAGAMPADTAGSPAAAAAWAQELLARAYALQVVARCARGPDATDMCAGRSW
jgi:hypothetical protein